MVLSRNKVNAILLYVAVFVALIRMLIYSTRGMWVLSHGNYYSYQVARGHFGSVPASALVLFFILLYNSKLLLRRKDLFWVLLCVFPFVFWSMVEFGNGEGIKVWLGSIPTTACLLPLFFPLGREESLSKHFRTVALILTVGYFLITLYSALDFYSSVGLGSRILFMPGKISLSLGMLSLWVYLFSDLQKKESGAVLWFKLGLILLALLCSVLIVSRSWSIQCLVLFLAYLSICSNLRGKLLALIGVATGLSVVLILAGPYVSNVIFPLIDRVQEDTRTGQFYEFFNQIDSWRLLFGSGMQATYVFRGEEYSFFDNQFIFEAFHYGILHLLPLLWFLLRTMRVSVTRIADIGRKRSYLGAKVVIVVFLLAMGGLSVYFRYDWTLPTALLLMFVGKHSVLPNQNEVIEG